MTQAEIERRRLKNQIHKHMTGILAGGVTPQELAKELHVTKQAISSYIKKRTTPKTHIVRRLLARWPSKFSFWGIEFGPEAYGAVSAEPTTVFKQGYLFDVLSALRKENMRFEVERCTTSETELRVIIKIAG